MDNKSPSQEEINQRREFAYRAYSPDSEPPSPLHDDKNQKNKKEPARQPLDPESRPAARENGRQNA